MKGENQLCRHLAEPIRKRASRLLVVTLPQLVSVRFVRRSCTPRTLAIVRFGAEEGATEASKDDWKSTPGRCLLMHLQMNRWQSVSTFCAASFAKPCLSGLTSFLI